MVREIKILGVDDVLMQKSLKVDNINEEIFLLLDDMHETMDMLKGIGLAAPQIGVLKRVVLAHDSQKGITYEMINPEILERHGRQIEYEGCLSVPSKMGKVKRPYSVKVTYKNRNNETLTVVANKDLARVFEHEIDHLDGILYTSKVIKWYN